MHSMAVFLRSVDSSRLESYRSAKSKEAVRSDPESLDDEVIRHKIQEANQLIERVRKALGKIKAIQSGDESVKNADKQQEHGSSSTDIEETIRGLKLQTQRLLTEETALTTSRTKAKSSCRRQFEQPEEKCEENPGVSDRNTVIRPITPKEEEEQRIMISKEQTFVKSPRDENDDFTRSLELTVVSKSKIPRPVQQTQTDESGRRGMADSWQVVGVVDLERPRTRRNEAEDDLAEQIRRDKFRTLPDTNQLEVSSSFEELQEKLKTIAETTESNRSTPRKNGEKVQPEFTGITQAHKCSNCIRPVSNCSQQLQVEPETNCMGVVCCCEMQTKHSQGRVLPALCAANRIATDFVPPRKRFLGYQKSTPLEIPPTNFTCTHCKTEILFPLARHSPTLRRTMCENCKGRLKEEFVGGVSIEPEIYEKIQKLSVKVLPPVIIKQPLKVTKVLDLSINAKGDVVNRLRNRTNVAYMDVMYGKELDFDPLGHFTSDVNQTEAITKDRWDDLPVESESTCTAAENEESRETRANNLKSILTENKIPEIRSNLDTDIPVKMVMKYEPKDDISEPDDEKTESSCSNGDLVTPINIEDYEYYSYSASYITFNAKRSDQSAQSSSKEPPAKDDDWMKTVKSTLLGAFNKDDSNIFDTLQREKEAIFTMQQKPNLSEDEQEELKKKLLWYQSYHIYDNPNQHDPGRMDQKSMEKISHVDLEFYKTFINPDPVRSGDITPGPGRLSRQSSLRSRFGFESKQVQVRPSSLAGGELGVPDSSQVPTKLTNAEQIKESKDTTENKEIKKVNGERKPSQQEYSEDYKQPSQQEFSEDYKQPSQQEFSEDYKQPSQQEFSEDYKQPSQQEFSGDYKQPSQQEFSEDYKQLTSLDPPMPDNSSQVTILNLKDDQEGKTETPRPTLSTVPSREESKSILQSPHVAGGSTTPSEITVTISYTLSEDEYKSDTTPNQRNNKSRSDSQEMEIHSSILDREPSFLEKGQSSKTLTMVDKDVMDKLRDKLRSVDTTASIPQFTVHNDIHRPTLENFLKGLTQISQGASSKTDASKNEKTINYLFTEHQTSPESLRSHLALAENGRYKDEQDMFTQMPFPVLTETPKRIDISKQTEYPLHDTRPPFPLKHVDKEVERDQFDFIPRRRFKKYSPDTSNSETITTNSLSEGEIGCRHSLSIGEIHVCRHRPQCPKARKSLLNRRHLTLSPPSFNTYLSRQAPKKFDLNDPSVSIEQRRTYFNNWVTYYVKPQDVYQSQSSTSNFSNPKNK